MVTLYFYEKILYVIPMCGLKKKRVIEHNQDNTVQEGSSNHKKDLLLAL